MEHYKSTFATIGAAITGLVLAAQILQTGPFTPETGRPERGRIAAPAEATAWADPPARLSAAPIAQADVPVHTAPAVPLPPLVPVAAAALAAPVAAAVPAPSPRKAAAPHRRKVVQRAARTRQAGLATQGAGAPAAVPQADVAPAPAPANRIDPIGDLIRGLGFGGDRQG